MALTERLALLVEAKTEGAIRGLKAIERELDVLEKEAKAAGREFDRVGERNARLSGLESGLDKLSAKTGIAAEQLRTFGITAGTAGAAIAVALGVQSVNAASALNEEIAKSSVVFGSAADKVLAFAQSANAIGLSDRAALQAAGSFGTLFVNVGQSSRKAAEMSERLVRLAADMASFSNTSVEDALAALQSGLNGEQEPLRRFGVFLNDATLKAEALRQGLISTTSSALAPGERAIAAYNVILQQTSLAQGDVERTSDSYANQTRQLKANIEDLQASLGNGLIPVVNDVVSGLNDVLGVIPGVIDKVQSLYDKINALPEKVRIVFEVVGLDEAGGFFEGVAREIGRQVKNKAIEFVDPTGISGIKHTIDDVNKALGLFGKKSDEAADALRGVEQATSDARAGMNSMLQVAQPVIGSQQRIRQALDVAAAGYRKLGADALASAQAQSQALLIVARAGSQAGVGSISEGAGSAPPPILRNQFVLSAEDVQKNIDEYLHALEAASRQGASSGVGKGLEDAEDEAEKLADYLQAVMRDRIEKLGNVFDGIAARLGFNDTLQDVDDATKKLAELRLEFQGIGAQVKNQQGIVAQLTQQAFAITPEEQQAIERAEANLKDVRDRFYGIATETVKAPGSSFEGPGEILKAGAKATLADLQVAENQLAKARADAVGPTRELEDAQKELEELRERAKGLPREIADAERDLTKAQLDLVEAQRRQLDLGEKLLAQGPEFVQQFRDMAAAVGTPSAAIQTFIAQLDQLRAVSAKAQGLVDVFGNGQVFRTPGEANDILSFIAGRRVEKFASGGVVPGPAGAPVPAIVHGGEVILNRAQQGAMGGNVSIIVSGAGDPDAVAERVYQKFKQRMGRGPALGFN